MRRKIALFEFNCTKWRNANATRFIWSVFNRL